jgi:type I restriction enzyme, R subunit
MNEAETRAELIDPMLSQCGWGITEGSRVYREHLITAGRIQTGGRRAKPLRADYVLEYKGVKLAAIEAKGVDIEVGEGVAQAKEYALKLGLDRTYSTNGKNIYSISMNTGKEEYVSTYPTPEQLWQETFSTLNEWREKFNSIPFEDINQTKRPRFYQEIAINKALEAIANNKDRILLTLATGTGKTSIAFQIAWKLFQTRWTLKKDGARRPRILFLADRNNLANQAFNEFSGYSAFENDALVRIRPQGIKNVGHVPTNGNIFFTIFQTFMSGTDAEGNPAPYFGDYPNDYFDFIIIDECHRGGANDESNWRGILEYFSSAVQLGMTATPKRDDNVDTYRYFGEPVYVYSLKEGINDGFLTPFKVRRIETTLDEYVYTPDDEVIEGEVEQGRVYTEPDFNRIIEIRRREVERVKIFMDEINQNEKTIVFCSTQVHAAAVRDLINQYKQSTDPNYCVRVTANDGELGEQYLRKFQDNDKTIPTILTTSQKLSTGVDARNIRNIILMRPVNSMIEFKQIIGRGTRIFDNKNFFTIYDFVDAYHHFSDPEWDGEPIEPVTTTKKVCSKCGQRPCICIKTPPEPPEVCPVCNQYPCICNKREMVRIKLADGKEREINHIATTSFWSADGRPISAEEFLKNLFGELPKFFQNEQQLREIWSDPITRKSFLEELDTAGYGKDELTTLQTLIDAQDSDLFDVLAYVYDSDIVPISREKRVVKAQSDIFASLDNNQKNFLEFVLSKYIEIGVDELDEDKLPILLQNKYQSLEDAKAILGDNLDKIRALFLGFQKNLYAQDI